MASSEWLLDSNILIDVLKGEAKALAWLDAHGAEAAISVRFTSTEPSPHEPLCCDGNGG